MADQVCGSIWFPHAELDVHRLTEGADAGSISSQYQACCGWDMFGCVVDIEPEDIPMIIVFDRLALWLESMHRINIWAPSVSPPLIRNPSVVM